MMYEKPYYRAFQEKVIRFLKEIPHNLGGSLTDDLQPSAACKFLDLPPEAGDNN
jgi:hypothetical protein